MTKAKAKSKVHTLVPMIELSIEPEDGLSVRDNAMASGDDAADKALEDEIIERLNRGDDWAWCCVKVTATVQIDGEIFSGCDYLGGCSYQDEKEFMHPDGYYPDMVAEACDRLRAELDATVERGKVAASVKIKNPKIK